MHFEDVYKRAAGQGCFDLVFKGECLIEKEYGKNVIPFPMSYKAEKFNKIERK